MNYKLIVIILLITTTKIVFAGMVRDSELLIDIISNEDAPDYVKKLIDWGEANGIEVKFGEEACNCIAKITGFDPKSRAVRQGGGFMPYRDPLKLGGNIITIPGKGPIIYIGPDANEGVVVHEQGHASGYLDDEFLLKDGDPVSLIDEEIRNWEKNKELYRRLGPEIYDEQLKYIQMYKRDRPYVIIERNRQFLNEIIARGGCAYIKDPKATTYKPYLVPKPLAKPLVRPIRIPRILR